MKVVKTVEKVMVPRAGVEPARPFGQRILSPQRLPFRHPGMLSTKSHGLSITRCLGYVSGRNGRMMYIGL